MISKDDFPYAFDPSACEACGGHCCTGESGYIWVSKDELIKIATFLNLNFDDFTNHYVKKVWYKFSLKEKQISPNNHACIFFDETNKNCKIYEVRPKQCREFPFWDIFKENIDEVKKECPGIS